MSTKARLIVIAAVVVLLGAVAVGYVRFAAGRAEGDTPHDPVSLTAPGLLIRSTVDGQLAVISPTGARSVAAPKCARVYAAAGRGVCIRSSATAPGQFELALLDGAGAVTRSIPLNGVPSRARVSASGRMVAWTVFVTGDSYTGGGFSTRSGILDTATNRLEGTLETFTATVDGKPYQAADINYWGTTFTDDDNRFYATMATGGHHYLVQGDFAARTFTALRDNVECPSLSPDGTRIAFKKRVYPDAAHPWRLAVLDLKTMHETLLAETRSVDDQAAWLDNKTVLYGLPRDRSSDVWAVPADGTGPPKVLVPDAESPAPLG